MEFLSIKSLHIIFVVSWFAGLFYMPRLFIYHSEASLKPKVEADILIAQFKIMERKLWYVITWPAGILTIVFGVWMLIINPAYLKMPWMHLKLGFVLILFIYHLYCHIIFKQLQRDVFKWRSFQLRLFNEVATLLLFAIVFTVVLKNSFSWIYALGGIIILGAGLSFAVVMFRKRRRIKEKYED